MKDVRESDALCACMGVSARSSQNLESHRASHIAFEGGYGGGTDSMMAAGVAAHLMFSQCCVIFVRVYIAWLAGAFLHT
jgi:hypothetical protein